MHQYDSKNGEVKTDDSQLGAGIGTWGCREDDFRDAFRLITKAFSVVIRRGGRNGYVVNVDRNWISTWVGKVTKENKYGGARRGSVGTVAELRMFPVIDPIARAAVSRTIQGCRGAVFGRH